MFPPSTRDGPTALTGIQVDRIARLRAPTVARC